MLGESQLNQGLYEPAMSNFEAARCCTAPLMSQDGVVRSFLAMGQTAVASGDYDRALLCYDWALPIAEDLDDALLVRDTANHLGNCYLARGIWKVRTSGADTGSFIANRPMREPSITGSKVL